MYAPFGFIPSYVRHRRPLAFQITPRRNAQHRNILPNCFAAETSHCTIPQQSLSTAPQARSDRQPVSKAASVSDREVERLLANLEIKSFASRDEQEVAGYAEVMELVFRSWQDITITENHIKQLHRDLLVYSTKDARHRGEYKTSSNSVAAFDKAGEQIGIVFATATPFDTPRLMTELITWFNQANDDRRLHPLLVIGIFAVVFLEIHPFQDGNGRLSRVLTTLLLLRAGYAYVPYGSLESVGRAKQGTILSRAATDAGNDPHSCSQLGTLAAVFSFRPASADATTREKNGTGKAGASTLAGSFRANLGSSSRTWAR